MQSFFPLKVGNWWIYEFYYLDANGNRTYKIQADSIIVTGLDTINGKPCYVLVEKCVEGSCYPDTEYYFNEGGRLYHYTAPGMHGKNPRDWYILANLKSYNWDMFSVYDTLPHGNNPSFLHAVANINNNFETKILFNGDTINCRNFSRKYKYTNRFMGLDGDTIENTIRRYETQFYYAKYIGIINQKNMYFEGYNSLTNKGVEKVLIDYGPK
ncbi:MAG: hypothetical protein A2X61_15140 [Ignavibacteria bacterium GWB2_35_12]|nr:MAG: hypothetical protein A2X63_12370 [Ignavibacteria bacterium GWA2_35_8]OGU41800.1 MAG: hypothetical protein A2X61_15140 [Ignavibacteria bacterium GWB2_35_12]OGU92598.1 MAG: hypothetical protein A2220_02455 [Ignavibacteria bacterium RIFOXYA2_FULL_35_10]OGV24340.1 MAG: hypothetical protein A2475_05215 [Ignavibacteria bacterium RIFOXYC2_FULL_35_21]